MSDELTFTEVDYDPFAEPAERSFPATEAQREIWGAVLLGEDASRAYNESVTLHLEGPVDVDALRAAIQDLPRMHEALRATFSPDGATIRIRPELDVEVPVLETPLPELIRAEATTAFDLERGPLFRASIARVTPEHHAVILGAHHIVCDGWSFGVLLSNLAERYRERVAGGGPPEPRGSFERYAEEERQWIASPRSMAAEAYWLERFEDAPAPPDLPVDRPRPPHKTFHSAREDLVVEAEVVTALKQTAAKQGSSLFAALLATFDVLLYRLCSQETLVVGIPTAGQTHCRERDLVGHCVNVMPLRTEISGDEPASEVLKRARGAMLDGTEHQRYTFGSLLQKLPLERDPSRLPLVSVLFNLDQALDAEQYRFDGVRARYEGNPRAFEVFEIFLNAVLVDGRLVLECQYNTDLFDETTIRTWLRSYRTLVGSLAQHPDAEIDTLACLSDEDVATLSGWNATSLDFDRDATVPALIDRRARENPDAVALRADGVMLSYGALTARSNQLARYLQARGVKAGELVGVSTERSVEMVVAVLAIQKAGAAYAPLDPHFPKERLRFMIDDAPLERIVTFRTRECLPAGPYDVIDLDEDQPAIDAQSTAPLPGGDPEGLAYVIYTSGSTGTPKGVQIRHRSVVSFLASMSERPGLDSSDTLLAVTTLSFDISVLELMLPLVNGGCVVIARRDEAMDGPRLLELIREHSVTVLQATPSTFRLLVAAGWSKAERLRVLCGGEALPADLARELTARSDDVWNMYGPTETTIWSSCARVLPNARVDLGHPIGNTELYIVTPKGARLPPTIPGELCIGGEGLAAGYRNRPDLTAERFVRLPCAPGVVYRTGDRARFAADGALEFLGRIDRQVKVRGFRIELGEIEAALTRHPDVSEAVATVREVVVGDARLVAYYVGAPELAPSLRERIREHLPEYMVPQHLVALDALPKTPNLKIDERALPAPEGASPSEAEFVAPRTDTERYLAEVWQEVLGVGRISVRDGFFRLGGHSLSAAQMLNRVRRDRGVSLPFQRIFEAKTIEALARELDGGGESGSRPTPRPHDTPAPATHMQERLWVIAEMEPGQPLYNLPSALRLRGPLDVRALETAFNALVSRHEALRTALRWHDGGLRQFVDPTLSVHLTPEPAPPGDPDDVALALVEEHAREHIPLDSAPLFRVRLFRLDERDHVLFFMPHHAIWDGWCFDLYFKELSALYREHTGGPQAELPALELTYRDYAAWHREQLEGERLRELTDYWKERVGDVPVLDLPTDFPRPPAMSHAAGTVPFRLTPAQVERLTRFAEARGSTLFMLLLTVYHLLLYRYSGQRDFVVGTPVRNREPDTENLIGFFVNLVLVRAPIDPSMRFEAFLDTVQRAAVEAFDRQDLPFELLLQELQPARDPSRPALYQAFFSFQDGRERPTELAGIDATRVPLRYPTEMHDVSLWVVRRAEEATGALNYNADVFSAERMERFVRHYERLLEAVAAAPTTALGAFELLGEEERAERRRWNRTETPYERDLPVSARVDAIANAYPSSIALVDGDGQMTYAELADRSDRIAGHLLAKGVKPGDRVGVCVERNRDMVALLLGVHKAGACYVPFDPSFPSERLAFMAEDAKLRMVATQPATADAIPGFTGEIVVLDPKDPLGEPLREAIAHRGSDEAYVIYTSGSTGKPKGVRISHGAMVNFLTSMQHQPGLNADDVLLAVTTLSFDIAVLELFLPLTVGAKIVLAGDEDSVDGYALLDLIEDHEVTAMQATPSTWRLLVEAGWDRPLKVLCGGEALPPDLARQLALRGGECWNVYGPTETTVWSTCHRFDREPEEIVVGRPIANTTLAIVDENGRDVPVGVSGEIVIGGDGVALGYLDRPELTAEKFIEDPDRPGKKRYRTGDLGRFRSDGVLEHLGRNDQQVKVRGYRIELGEVENALAASGLVTECVVVVRERSPGDQWLVAYLVPATTGLTQTALRDALRTRLPEYLVPQLFVELDALPKTPNQKVDRNALPTPFGNVGVTEREYIAPATDREREIAAIWGEILEVDQIGRDDNFFDLGGHSLLAMRAVMAMRERLGLNPSLGSLVLDTLQNVAAESEAPKSDSERGLLSRLRDR